MTEKNLKLIEHEGCIYYIRKNLSFFTDARDGTSKILNLSEIMSIVNCPKENITMIIYRMPDGEYVMYEIKESFEEVKKRIDDYEKTISVMSTQEIKRN